MRRTPEEVFKKYERRILRLLHEYREGRAGSIVLPYSVWEEFVEILRSMATEAFKAMAAVEANEWPLDSGHSLNLDKTAREVVDECRTRWEYLRRNVVFHGEGPGEFFSIENELTLSLVGPTEQYELEVLERETHNAAGKPPIQSRAGNATATEMVEKAMVPGTSKRTEPSHAAVKARSDMAAGIEHGDANRLAPKSRKRQSPHPNPEEIIRDSKAVNYANAARVLGVTVRHIRFLVAEGSLVAQGDGQQKLITVASLMARWGKIKKIG